MSIKQIIRLLLIAIVVTAFYKVSGGDLSGVLSTALKFLSGLISAGSDWLISTGVFNIIK